MRKLIGPFLLLLLVIIVFHSWFLPGLLSSFDFPYYSHIMIRNAHLLPYAWDFHIGLDGFARFISPYSWIMLVVNTPQMTLGKIGFDWGVQTRLFYLYPLLILLILSPIIFTKYFFPKNKFYLISVIIFAFNTYSLLLSAGQIFLALVYSLIPLMFVLFVHSFKISNINGISKFKFPIITGLVFSLQILIEPRFAIVTLLIIALYFLFLSLINFYKFNIRNIIKYIYCFTFVFLLPLIISILLNAFWILPSVVYGGNPVEKLGAGYSTIDAVKFLSFAKFENTISLLHPNWPENIFGKVYFMHPEFLFIPILAFASLFFINRLKERKEKTYILFFVLLALFGAFLSKGSNDPFGGIYLWMFEHIPGFIMFRDPTKWYPLVAVSYSILIPFSIWNIYGILSSKFKVQSSKVQLKIQNYVPNLFLILATLYLILLIRPAIFGQLGGMFKATNVPDDYVRLEKFLVNQPDYFRTLWIPSKQKFGYYSNNHPEISAQILFNDTNSESLFKKLSERKTKKLLQETSIKYVIVPNDSEKEIFLTDRKYDDNLYKIFLKNISKISYLKKIEVFGKIGVFELFNAKDHFWSSSPILEIQYKYINPTKYFLSLNNAKKGDVVVFTESYDHRWIARNSEFIIQSSEFNKRFNSFILPKDGNYNLDIYYSLQKYVNIGLIISIFSLVFSIIFLIFLKFKK